MFSRVLTDDQIQRILTLPDWSMRYGILFGIATLFIGAGALAFTARQAIGGAITLGSLVMYYQAFQTGLSQLQNLLRSYNLLD